MKWRWPSPDGMLSLSTPAGGEWAAATDIIVDALDDDHRSRALLVVHPHLQPQQLKLQPLELLVVLDPLDPQRRVEVGDTRRAAV